MCARHGRRRRLCKSARKRRSLNCRGRKKRRDEKRARPRCFVVPRAEAGGSSHRRFLRAALMNETIYAVGAGGEGRSDDDVDPCGRAVGRTAGRERRDGGAISTLGVGV